MWFISEAISEDKAFYECEPPHDKTNKMAFAPSEDSDQPGHPPNLIRVFTVRSMGSWGPNVSSCGQRRLIRLGVQTGRTPRLICVFSGRSGHFVGFVMRRLMYILRVESESDCGSRGRWFDWPGHISFIKTDHAHFFTDRKRQLSDV